MSTEVHTLCQKRRVGNPTVKAVLMYMADRAADDGSGIWTSKANMAADLELSKRSVQNSISELIERGLVSEAGSRKCDRGFTVDYTINLSRVEALPLVAVENKGSITLPFWLRRHVFDRDGNQCQYCGARAHLTIDHRHPQCLGGDHSINNRITACRPCNAAKGAKPYAVFIASRGAK